MRQHNGGKFGAPKNCGPRMGYHADFDEVPGNCWTVEELELLPSGKQTVCELENGHV